jgi:hypothetical protein
LIFYAYIEELKMSEKLTDKYNAIVSSHVPAAPCWYLREQNNEGKNVYHPVMAWRECFGVGPLKDGVLIPVLPSGLIGRAVTEICGDVMYMPDSLLSANGDGTFRDRRL